MSRAIFTYYNFQVQTELVDYQKRVVSKFIPEDIVHETLEYKQPDGVVLPFQVLDYAINELFYNKGYDSVMVLDVDAIPLSTFAITQTFDIAEFTSIVGNAQRSNHIENNQHVYVGSPLMTFTRKFFEQIGKPSFAPTHRGDTGEEFSYLAREKGLGVEMYMPAHYEANPTYQKDRPWDLADGMPKYGIGTTYRDEVTQTDMFYHLFESRVNTHNELFIAKCQTILMS